MEQGKPNYLFGQIMVGLHTGFQVYNIQVYLTL